jgi:hypothetical protein
MENLNKSLPLLLLVCSMQDCTSFKNQPFEWVVMAERPPTTVEPLPDYCSTFIPTLTERKTAERALNQAYTEQYFGKFESNSPLSQFNRQYFGYINDKKERVIFIQCFLKSVTLGRPIKKIGWFPIYDDGCEAVFRLQVNLKTGQYFKFNINSCA